MHTRNMDLSGRVIAITGASSGIGQAVAIACAQAGAAVALGGRRADLIEATARRIEDDGGTAIALPLDVADEESAHAFVHRAADRLGGLDVLVNNAGLFFLGPIETSPSEEWRAMIDVNVLGVLYCTQAALPLLRQSGQGDIVMMSSIGGRVVGHWSGVYSLTKFGIGALSEALRQETLQDDIRVIVVEPGRVRTELRDHMDPAVLEQITGDFEEVTPMEARDVAEMVLISLTQPRNVHISELLMRPARSPM